MAKASVIAARQADMLTLIAERLARIEAHLGIVPEQPVSEPVADWNLPTGTEWDNTAGIGQSAEALIQYADAQPSVEIGTSVAADAVEVVAEEAEDQADSAETPSNRGSRSNKK